MRREDLPKLLNIDDRQTFISATLPTTANALGGLDSELKFRYNDEGLCFVAKHYQNWVPVFHGYDKELYTDAVKYLEAITPNVDHRQDWAADIRDRMHAFWVERRRKAGQPVWVHSVAPDTQDVGFIKKVDGEAIVVSYRGGLQLTAKLKTGRHGIQRFVARNGAVVTLGAPYPTT